MPPAALGSLRVKSVEVKIGAVKWRAVTVFSLSWKSDAGSANNGSGVNTSPFRPSKRTLRVVGSWILIACCKCSNVTAVPVQSAQVQDGKRWRRISRSLPDLCQGSAARRACSGMRGITLIFLSSASA